MDDGHRVFRKLGKTDDIVEDIDIHGRLLVRFASPFF
jgi:hypothetical protein